MSSGVPRVRRATRNDAEAVADFIASERPDWVQYRDWITTRDPDGILALVVETDRICGLLYASVISEPQLSPCRILAVHHVIVREGERSLPLLRRLMSEAKSWGREQGADTTTLLFESAGPKEERLARMLGFPVRGGTLFVGTL